MELSYAFCSFTPKPVTVRLCFGRLNPGPTGPFRSDNGADIEGVRSRPMVDCAMMLNVDEWKTQYRVLQLLLTLEINGQQKKASSLC